MPAPTIAINPVEILNSLGSWKIKIIKLIDFFIGTAVAVCVKGRSPQATPPRSSGRMLLIRPGGIGDAVSLIPVVKEVKKRFPQFQVDILCEQRNAGIFVSQRHLFHEIYLYDRFTSFLKLWQNCYDIVVDTEQWHLMSTLVGYFLRPRYIVGFKTRGLRMKLVDKAVDYDVDGYELDNFRRLFLDWITDNIFSEVIASSLSLSPEIQSWVGQQNLGEFVVLSLGAYIPARRLTIPQADDIITFFISQGLEVVLLGTRESQQESLILEKNHGKDNLKNLVGQTTFPQAMAVIKSSRLFVGPDSGLMHVAYGLGVPLIAIFGPGNMNKWAPRGNQVALVSLHLRCSPCTRFGHTVPTCDGRYSCMRDIHLNDLRSAFSRIGILDLT